MLFVHFPLSLPQPVAAQALVVEHKRILDTLAQVEICPIASIVKIPPVDKQSPPFVAYEDLACTDVDQQKIKRIISTIAENGKLTLLLEYRKELNTLGVEITHVHPLKFLACVFSQKTLKEGMFKIHDDYFKWRGFMDGLGPSLSNQARMDRLNVYLPNFVKELNLPLETVQSYIQAHDWENLVLFLIQN